MSHKNIYAKRIYRCLILFFIFLFSYINLTFYAKAETAHESINPAANKTIKKWRLAYYEGGNHSSYLTILRSTLHSLMYMGWLKKTNLPAMKDHKKFWEWISVNIESDHIEFVADAFYSADFDSNLRKIIQNQAIERFNFKKDIDLIMAFGTWAGLDLVNSRHQVNTMVTSSSDPVASGMIPDAENSGFAHIHVHMDPDRYLNQVQLFHQITGFNTLGIVYENTKEGRSYASVSKIEKAAETLGFDLISCHAAASNTDQKKTVQSIIKCHETLAQKVEAIYITSPIGIDQKYIPQIIRPLIKEKIYTFAQSGTNAVKAGAMFSLEERSDSMYTARFYASNIAKVLNGAMPGNLKQIYSAPTKTIVNLETVRKIGYVLPMSILEITDEFYY